MPDKSLPVGILTVWITEGARTYDSQVTSYNEKEEKKYESNKTNQKDKGTAVTSANSTTTITNDLRDWIEHVQ